MQRPPITVFPPSLRICLFTILLILAVGLAACKTTSPDNLHHQQWSENYLSALGLSPEESEAALEELIRNAPDEGKAREAGFERARIALRRGDIDTARQRFQSLFDDRKDDNIASRALYELGRIAAEHDDDPQEAHRLLSKAITETAPWAGAEFALDYLIHQEQRAGRTEELATHIGSMAERVKNDRLGARLHLEEGRLLAAQRGRSDDALHAYRDAYKRCKDCSAADDALFEMSEVYVSHQRWSSAVAALHIIANRTQRSFFVGTYNSHRSSDARFELGMIEFLFRSDYSAATDHFETFLDAFPHDPRADDAAWHLVEIERISGTQRSHRRALTRFLQNYPESRHAQLAQRRLEEMT